MAQISEWEKNRIEYIDEEIQKCQLKYIKFQREHQLLNRNICIPQEQVLQRLRHFATGLHSVLDDLCHLCFCHSKNNGNPVEAGDVKFPDQPLERSNDQRQEDDCRKEREEFVLRYFKLFFFPRDVVPDLNDVAIQEKYNRFKEVIETCQKVTTVKENKKPEDEQPDPTEAAKNFHTLQCLRSHPCLVYVKKVSGSTGCLVNIPSFRSSEVNTPVKLLVIAPKLLDFVIDCRNNLIEIAFGQDASIPTFDKRKVRFGFVDGVHIDGQGDSNGQHYTWDQFDKLTV